MIVPLLLVPTRFAGRFPAWVRARRVEFAVVGVVWVGFLSLATSRSRVGEDKGRRCAGWGGRALWMVL